MIHLLASVILSNPLAVNESTTIAYPFDTVAQISSGFSNSRKHPILKYNRPHRAIDMVKPCGTPVKSSIDGKVTVAGSYGTGYGKAVIVQNATQKTLIGHVSKVLVKVGQEVRKGDVIALVGTEGWSSGCHLHQEYFIKNNQSTWQAVDPLLYFDPSQVDTLK